MAWPARLDSSRSSRALNVWDSGGVERSDADHVGEVEVRRPLPELASYGGSAPTLEEAARIDVEEKAARAARKAARERG